MKRTTPMRRKARFGSQLLSVMDREQRLEARDARNANRMEVVRAAPACARGVVARILDTATPVPKDAPARSEAYLRLVALRPCINCGRVGLSQAAHLPPIGKGIKQDDRLTMPLCADQPGALGCHSKFDRYILFPREQAMQVSESWAAQTRTAIREAGTWPRNLPEWSER
jgi:hypothetical protein